MTWLTRHARRGAGARRARPGHADAGYGEFRRGAGSVLTSRRPRTSSSSSAGPSTQLEHGTVHMGHPRYFGLFNPAPTFPAAVRGSHQRRLQPAAGEFRLLAGAGGDRGARDSRARAPRGTARRVRRPLHDRGSEANYTALVCALTRAAAQLRRVRACAPFQGRSRCTPRASASRPGSRSRTRPASDAMRLQADRHRLARARWTPRRWRSADRARPDSAGIVPVLISATAGTTGGGMVDPLHALRAISRARTALWYHVDAAWGGAALCSDASARRARRHRAGRLDHHRRAQVVCHHHGLRHVRHALPGGAERGVPGGDGFHAVDASRRSIPT